MKQIIQSFKTGETILEELPVPMVKTGCVLIKTTRTLVSLGTEKMLVDFGKANYIQKAKQQPDKVKMVLDKIKSDGLLPTIDSVMNKLDSPLPLGYCNAGVVVEVGEGVTKYKIGDRVISNGHHAEYVCVPENLTAKIPDNVSEDQAAFTVVSSIGLQGIRLCAPTFGETIVVYGMGLIGLIVSRLLIANGCHVIGIDLDDTKLSIAEKAGVKTLNPKNGNDVVQAVTDLSGGEGADGVIITASAHTNEIISNSAQMSRKRGRIVLVGVIGLDISRADFYEKELSFQVSCSYGAGRYDEEYEQKGTDYPIGYVRWTEQRNFEAILGALSMQTLKVDDLITEKVPIEDYMSIYGDMGKKDSIASIITFSGNNKEYTSDRTITLNSEVFGNTRGQIGVIGAGNFTKAVVLPALKKAEAKISIISSANGLSGKVLAKKFSISKTTSNYTQILNDPDVGMVLVMTRHNLHASMVKEVIKSGKSVFVEKPLALSISDFHEIESIYKNSIEEKKGLSINVGFNRRFSPHSIQMKSLLKGAGAVNISVTMNAGYIPSSVWVHDMEIGGGRILGEACHLIDLLIYLTGSKVKSVSMNALGVQPKENTDNATLLLEFENGSNGVINYFSNGSKAYSKERVEAYWQNKTLIMDNFRVTKGYGTKGFRKLKTKLDKGHNKQFRLLNELASGKSRQALIPFDEIKNTTLTAFAAMESFKTNKKVYLSDLV